ncbi:hypothetical protein JMJ56_11205 [Belnapia sp. T18]|uniref:S-layer homology domain-containing protein n=1 Tax=Belnapia arida TaxID=2804533 RepID=A0ABS1U1K8_9PROT|nr:hypothetical protein [Belnapia arida]MBL6078575.1 hypothetical protein [Belnapia arida]
MSGYLRRLFALLAAILSSLSLAACGTVDFSRPGIADPEAGYAAAFPWYAEFCALSQIRKRPGFGAEIRGDIGGHAVLYLNGACRGPDGTLIPCDTPGAGPEGGVGLSMNAHFRNAKWVAIPGRDFFFEGNLRPGETLTRARYAEVLAEARSLGLYDGVAFHDAAMTKAPPGLPPEAAKYEVSIATDYAVGLGRGRYCARAPMTRAQMLSMIAFLNAENAPYRRGEREFHWSLFQDNCIHLAHNALAAAGFWRRWPTHRPLPLAILDFPVPKNEFVNLMRRGNDATLLDPEAAFADPAARRAVLDFGTLPVRPGAIALSAPAWPANAVYETELGLVFYDEPTLGPYRHWLAEILATPRQHALEPNLHWYAARLHRLREERRPLPPEMADFGDRFYAALDRELAGIDRRLERLRAARTTPATGLALR